MNFKSKKRLSLLLILNLLIFSILMPVQQINTVYAADIKYEAYYQLEGSFAFNLYVRPKGSLDLGIIVYCFNHDKTPPYLDHEAPKYNGPVAYTKVTGFSDTLKEKMSNPRIQDEDELEKKLLAVIANGYPMNSSGLQGTLSDESFRKVTQIAIWYFTDTKEIDQNHVANVRFPLSNEEKEVVKKLIDSTYDGASNMKIDFYIADNSKYQNLLAANITPVTIEKINIAFSKQNVNGAELEGAEIEIRNADDTETVEGWISDGTEKNVSLYPGTYIFREKKAPAGYLKVNDFTFKVNRHGIVTIVNQSDTDKVTVEANKLIVIDQADPENPTPVEPENPTPVEPENPTPVEPENPTPVEPENPTPVEPENPISVEPENPISDEPENPTPVEPENPTPVEPVNLISAEPENPISDEPVNLNQDDLVKLASIEPVNLTPDEPENPTPEIPVNPVPVDSENIVTEVQVVKDENKRTVVTPETKWKKELPKTGYTTDQYRLLGMLLLSLTMIFAYFINRKRDIA